MLASREACSFCARARGGPVRSWAAGLSGLGGEPYIALGSGHAVRGANCSFRGDDIFVLIQGATPGVLRVDRNGRSHPFASLQPGTFPSGIASDRVGSFGYRLLVMTTASGKATLYASTAEAGTR